VTRPRVLLADDHSMVVEGLRKVLEPEVELVGTVADGRALMKAAAQLEPDIIIVDISMPLLNGLDAAREIKKDLPRVKIIVLTMHTDVEFAEEAFRAGASGFLVKRCAAEELVESPDSRSSKYTPPFVATQTPPEGSSAKSTTPWFPTASSCRLMRPEAGSKLLAPSSVPNQMKPPLSSNIRRACPQARTSSRRSAA